jgi:hypothetical protein
MVRVFPDAILSVPLNVEIPPAAPMLRVVDAPAKLTVVAVVLRRSKEAEPVTIESVAKMEPAE